MQDAVRAALIALSDRNGGTLTAAAVVAAARDSRSPLHNEFIWDDREAAAQHRILQARQLIRAVRIEISVTELTAPQRMPMFAFVPASSNYATLDHLRQDSDFSREAAIWEFAKAAAALRRAQQIAIGLGLGAEAIATVAALIGSVQAAQRRFPDEIAQVGG